MASMVLIVPTTSGPHWRIAKFSVALPTMGQGQSQSQATTTRHLQVDMDSANTVEQERPLSADREYDAILDHEQISKKAGRKYSNVHVNLLGFLAWFSLTHFSLCFLVL
jgi:hypothetical protein